MKTSGNLPALFNALIFVGGAIFLSGLALLMGVAALASLFTRTGVYAGQTILLVAFGFEGLVLFVAAFFVFQKFLQKPPADEEVSITIPNWLSAVFVAVAGAALLIGYFIGTVRTIAWLVLPVLTIPAVVLPLVALLALGTRQFPLGTRSQTWSVLGLAMTLTPLALFILEILVAVMIVFGVVLYVMTQPELAASLQALAQQIRAFGPSSNAARDLLSPYLTNPIVIAIALIYMAGIVPAIEEIFKPLGVWFFAGSLESEAQGFALGALSGAGYALIETAAGSGQTTEWANLLFSRVGTGLLHITTSALMGAAIVLAWRQRRYARLLGTYMLAVLLHGLWNFLAMLLSFSENAKQFSQGGWLSTIQPAMTVALVVLAIGLFVIFLVSSRNVRKVSSPPAQTVLSNGNTETGSST